MKLVKKLEVNLRTDWSSPLPLPDQILPPQKRQDDTLAAQNLATQEKIASMQVEKKLSLSEEKSRSDTIFSGGAGHEQAASKAVE